MIVGHSLGAAAAAILALTLRKQYPTLQCLGYGMPASVFDWVTAQGARCPCCACDINVSGIVLILLPPISFLFLYSSCLLSSPLTHPLSPLECSEYVTSLVLDSDMVARMSVHAMATLRAEVLDCIGQHLSLAIFLNTTSYSV